jgi:hypothetical protein
MAQYFFKMTNEERSNILDQHKTIYDGYVTEYAQGENKQPLYVQDFANDKGGITVDNKGNVKPYTNVGINESIDSRLDMIGDGENDLKNGTVDFSSIDKESNHDYHHDRYPSPGEDDDVVYMSLGLTNDDEEVEPMYHHKDSRSKDMLDKIKYDRLIRYNGGEFDGELDEVDDTILGLKPEWSDDYEDEEIVNDIYDDNFDEVDEEEKDEFLNKLNESLDMFRRFKKYN